MLKQYDESKKTFQLNLPIECMVVETTNQEQGSSE